MAPIRRGIELTAEEHAARQICKLLGVRPLDAGRLKTEWVAIRRELSRQRRPALAESDWDRALATAADRGWIAEKDGCWSATEAGQLVAKRSRTATRKPRSARLRSVQF